MFMLLTGLFAVALSLSSTLATAQQVCQRAGDNKRSNDPNAVLNWTLTTHVNTPCIATVNTTVVPQIAAERDRNRKSRSIAGWRHRSENGAPI